MGVFAGKVAVVIGTGGEHKVDGWMVAALGVHLPE